MFSVSVRSGRKKLPLWYELGLAFISDRLLQLMHFVWVKEGGGKKKKKRKIILKPLLFKLEYGH